MELQPLTHALLESGDFRRLTCFEEGACWCGINQFTTMTHEQWDALSAGEGLGNKTAMRAALDQGKLLGFLAFEDGAVVGWCGCGKLGDFPRFSKRAVELGAAAESVAAIVCFSISPERQRQGLATRLLQAVCVALFEMGFAAIEAYPFPEAVLTQPNHERGWMGYPAMYRACGFQALNSQCPHATADEDRPVYRLEAEIV